MMLNVMSMFISTIPGRMYCVTSSAGCKVTDTKGVLLADVEKNQQTFFQATTEKTIISDISASVLPFEVAAPAALGGGSKRSGDGASCNVTISETGGIVCGPYASTSGGGNNTGIAIGTNSNAGGYYAQALGFYAAASGYGSTALGHNSMAVNGATQAFGIGAVASGYASVAIGTQVYNEMDGTTAVLTGFVLPARENDWDPIVYQMHFFTKEGKPHIGFVKYKGESCSVEAPPIAESYAVDLSLLPHVEWRPEESYYTTDSTGQIVPRN